MDTSISSHRVVRQLEQLVQWRGKPERIRVDNGPEFIAQALELWCKERGIELHFIRPAPPGHPPYREEVLDANLFETLQQVRRDNSVLRVGQHPPARVPVETWTAPQRTDPRCRPAHLPTGRSQHHQRLN
ncbi:MAG: transposase family protein [Flavobacteriales bacterium]|nr:transposase family protein [Flavobacteriales bacterium]